MNFKKELLAILKQICRCAILALLIVIIVCSFGPKQLYFYGHTINAPSINANNSYVGVLFSKAKKDLLPSHIELITLDPISALFIKLKISLLISLFFVLPYFLYSLLRYITPALFFKEKILIYSTTLASIFLFYGGALFAYKYILSSMFGTLLSFHNDLGIHQYLSVNEFVSWSLSTLFVTGIMFLSPILMYALAGLNIVQYNFWLKYWRECLVIFLIFAAIITPDVSGLSLFIMMIPMTALYLLGLGLSYSCKK